MAAKRPPPREMLDRAVVELVAAKVRAVLLGLACGELRGSEPLRLRLQGVHLGLTAILGDGRALAETLESAALPSWAPTKRLTDDELIDELAAADKRIIAGLFEPYD